MSTWAATAVLALVKEHTVMIATHPFGRTAHESTRAIFGAAALSRVTQEDADRTLEVLDEGETSFCEPGRECSPE